MRPMTRALSGRRARADDGVEPPSSPPGRRRLAAALVAVVAPVALTTPASAQAPSLPLVLPSTGEVVEGDEGLTPLEVPVVLSRASAEEVTVAWTTFRSARAPFGQAAPGLDYVPASGTLTFAPGTRTASVTIEVIANTVPQPDRWVAVSFTDPTNARMGGFWGIGFGRIIDDDGPAVVPGGVEVQEGDEGLTPAQVPVTLSEPSDQEVTVEYSTIAPDPAPPVRAGAGTDYQPASGTVTFAPGETEATVTINVIGNTDPQPDRYVTVSFRNPTNARMGGFWGLGFVSIIDDDGPTIAAGTGEAAPAPGETAPLAIPVTLDGPSYRPVTVQWSTVERDDLPGEPAEAGVDYVPASGTVTFAPGQTEATVVVEVIGTVGRGDRTVAVELSAPTRARLGDAALGLGTVIGNEAPPPEEPAPPPEDGIEDGDAEEAAVDPAIA